MLEYDARSDPHEDRCRYGFGEEKGGAGAVGPMGGRRGALHGDPPRALRVLGLSGQLHVLRRTAGSCPQNDPSVRRSL